MSRSGLYSLFLLVCVAMMAVACGAPTGNTAPMSVNSNASVANSLSNSNMNVSTTATGNTVDAKEPDQYQANIKLSIESMGTSQTASLPTLGATVARSGDDRVMVFNLPTNEKAIYLDKGGQNYLILPNRKQYAELNKESTGVEIRRLLMPEQIVNQIKGINGVTRAGEETANGRQVVKYTYEAAANTNTQAGTVGTQSVILVDKETGLPLRSETVSKSQNGSNVNGITGLRVVTEMTDITATPDTSLFQLPTNYQKIDPETVKAQINLIFNVVANVIGQAMNTQNQAAPANANSAVNTNTNTIPSNR